jgi:hypothetical protein
LLTISLMLELRGAVPLLGDWSATVPTGTVSLKTCSVVYLKPALLTVSLACASGMPCTLGTGMSSGPLLTISLTTKPRRSGLPTGGSVAMT